MQERIKTKRYAIGIVASVTILGALGWLLYSRDPRSDSLLQASGQVRGTEITISSKQAGTVTQLLIKEGQRVSQGNLIATISSEEIAARLSQAKAQAAAARDRLRQIEADTRELESAIEEARINVKLAEGESFHGVHEARAALQRADAAVQAAQSQYGLATRDRERYSSLLKKGTVSKREFDVVEVRFETAAADFGAARQAREEALAALQKAQVSALGVNVRSEELKRLLDQRAKMRATYALGQDELASSIAQVKEVEASYQDTQIRAPAQGTIINKLVEPGELVTDGTPLAVLVDLSQLYVRVFIPEEDIGKIRLGDPAKIYADAFPRKYFPGTVTEVSQQAEFTPHDVQVKEERTKLVFGVKIAIANPQGYLKPGMPVDVTIRWGAHGRR